MERPTPFDLVFSGLAPEQFPALRDALATAAADPRDRDAFLLTRPAMTVLRELRPADAEVEEGLAELTALLHHAYLHWADGLQTWTLRSDDLRRLLGAGRPPVALPAESGYLQLPKRQVWASLGTGNPWEPMDGCFVHATPDGALRVLGVFGLHPARDGFTVAEAVGRGGGSQARGDGTPLFAPSLEGGARAGLHGLVEPGELVELAARAVAELAPEHTGAEGG